MKDHRSFSAAQVRILVVMLAFAAAMTFALTVSFGGALWATGIFASAQTKQIEGEWTATVSKKTPGDIHFTFSRRSDGNGFNMSGETFKMAELQGLTATHLDATARSDAKFTILGDAGTFACDGMFREGRGTGFWTFSPSEAFRNDMKNRGYGYLNDEELMRAALNKLTRKYVDELKAAGYDKVEYKDLLRASGDGVTAAYIRDIKSAGFPDLSLKQLTRAADNGVSVAFVRDMRSSGFTAATIEQLSRAADNGVTAAYIREVQSTGLSNLTLEQISRAADEKITTDYIREMKGAGFAEFTLEQIIRLKDEDVTARFVEEIRSEGFPDITPSLVIRLKDEDVDRDFIRRAKSQGYNVTLQEMIRLKDRGTVK